MRPGNANGVAAVLLVVLLLMGTLAILPSWHASATQAEPIVFGWVYEDIDASGNYNLSAEGLGGIHVSLNDISEGIVNVAENVTESSGYFTVRAPKPSYYEVVIGPEVNPFKEGKIYFTHTVGGIRLEFGQNESLGNISLETREIDSTVSGTITDALGDPVSGATVTILDPFREYSNSTTSDADGTYVVDFYSGTHQIQVTHPNLSPHFNTTAVIPQGDHALLANTDVVAVHDIVVDGRILGPGEYSVDLPNHVISFIPPLGPDAVVSANYTYNSSESESLVLFSLGNEPEATLASPNVVSSSLVVRNNGTVWPDYTFYPGNSTVRYDLPLNPGMNLTAAYNYSTQVGPKDPLYVANGSETSFSLRVLQAGEYLLDETLEYFDSLLGIWYPMNNTLAPGAFNYTVNNTTGIVTLGGWSMMNFGDRIRGVYNYTTSVDFEYLTTSTVLAFSPVNPNSDNITKNGSPLTRGVDYTIDPASGEVNFTIPLFAWDSLAAEYERPDTTNESLTLEGGTTYDVVLLETRVWGIVLDSTNGQGVTASIRAVLYDEANNRTIASTSSEVAKYDIATYAGTFTLVVDADGYASYTQTGLSVTGPEVKVDVSLLPAEDEEFTTTVSFVGNDWNVIRLNRSWSLNADSAIPGLDNPDVSNLRLQIDSALGDGDGTLAVNEIDNFLSWLLDRGPRFVVTRDVLTVDNEYYRSNESTFAATFEPYQDSTINATGRIWINTTATYDAAEDPELDKETYTIVVNGTYDSDNAVYRDRKYVFQLPTDYELVGNATNPPDVSVIGFTTVTVDPGTKPPSAPQVPTATLDIQRRLNGTAIARVANGTFHPVDESPENYTVIVRGNENITFSADQSTDPNSPDGMVSPFANFTWELEPGVFGYGIETTHNYTVGANYTVNLMITEAGGNVTSRSINVSVDTDDPVARADIVSKFEMDNGTYVVKEGQVVVFNGTNSTDTLFGTVPGSIGTWEWDWEGDGTVDSVGEVSSNVFPGPGDYSTILRVTDVVGHESADFTMSIRAEDVTPPDPGFVVLNDTFVEVNGAIENTTFYFNASQTEDNLDALENLTFRWDFGDNTTIGPGQPGEFVNVTHVFGSVNTTGFTVNLSVTDKAGNEGLFNMTLVVLIKTSSRPNLQIIAGSFGADPGTVEQDQTTTLTIKVKNEAGRANATNVQVQFMYLSGGQKGERVSIGTPDSVQWFNETGELPTDNNIAADETKTARITWSHNVIGNYTIYVNVTADGEWSGDLGDNNIDIAPGWVIVVEAGWVRPVLYVVIFLMIVAVPLLLWIRKKRQRGELIFGRREKGEEKPREKKPRVKK